MGWKLNGRVLAEGTPASGAEVRITQFLPGVRSPDVWLSARCDAEGRFSVDVPRPAMANVWVSLRGHVWGFAHPEGPDAPPLVIHLERGASVHLRHEGADIPQRTPVILRSDSGMWEGEIGSREGCELDGLPPGFYRVTLESKDVELVEPREIVLEPKRSHDLTLKIRAR